MLLEREPMPPGMRSKSKVSVSRCTYGPVKDRVKLGLIPFNSGLTQLDVVLSAKDVDDLIVMLEYYKRVALGEIKEGEKND